jgi:hypothetical protein
LINNRTQLLNGDITTGNGVVHIVDNIIIADNTTAKEANKADKLLDSSALGITIFIFITCFIISQY